VPGHERFVRTMVAGATGIDLFLMAVAADDGVMPQTREHFAVLRALGIGVGVVAVTKCDLAAAPELDVPWEVVPCSTRTGEGIEDVRAALERAASQVTPRAADGAPVLHIDRVFSVKGAGTVVTGTLWAGSIGRGDVVRLLPAGRDARVRGVEVHDEPCDRADAGQRVAVNLAGVDRDEVARGDVLAGEDARASYILDVALDARLDGERVTVHHGTRETPARVAWLGGRFHQLRCEQPLIARRGDRFVLRSIAPPDTIGGGEVLDPAARKHGPSREVTARLSGAAPAPIGRSESREAVARSPALGGEALALEERLRAAGVEAPAFEDVRGAALDALRAHGRAERVGRSVFHADTLAAAEARVRALIESEGAVTLARLRDELGTSRKYAQALLEHLDLRRVTRRLDDDSRVLRG